MEKSADAAKLNVTQHAQKQKRRMKIMTGFANWKTLPTFVMIVINSVTRVPFVIANANQEPQYTPSLSPTMRMPSLMRFSFSTSTAVSSTRTCSEKMRTR